MPHTDFVHLRVHTAYSLLEGAIRIPDLVAKCGAERMPAVAITDTDNLFGALEFSSTSAAGGIQPIIGCQLSLTPDAAEESHPGSRNGGPETLAVLIVLAQNQTGYANLLKLVSSAYLDVEDASRPQVPLSVVETYAEGLIALTGGVAGPVGRHLADGQEEKAEAALLRLAAAFPSRLYMEVSRHGLDSEAAIEPALIDLAYRHDLPLVATNEAFFIDAEMFEAHDALPAPTRAPVELTLDREPVILAGPETSVRLQLRSLGRHVIEGRTRVDDGELVRTGFGGQQVPKLTVDDPVTVALTLRRRRSRAGICISRRSVRFRDRQAPVPRPPPHRGNRSRGTRFRRGSASAGVPLPMPWRRKIGPARRAPPQPHVRPARRSSDRSIRLPRPLPRPDRPPAASPKRAHEVLRESYRARSRRQPRGSEDEKRARAHECLCSCR